MEDRPTLVETAEAIADFIDWGFSPEDIKIAWQALPPIAQNRVLAALMATQNDWAEVLR
jgi:hypothetical protein